MTSSNSESAETPITGNEPTLSQELRPRRQRISRWRYVTPLATPPPSPTSSHVASPAIGPLSGPIEGPVPRDDVGEPFHSQHTPFDETAGTNGSGTDNESSFRSSAVNSSVLDQEDGIEISSTAQREQMLMLTKLFSILERGKISEALSEEILRCPALKVNSTRARVSGFVKREAGINARYTTMCRNGHMAGTGQHIEVDRCLVCNSQVDSARRFWYMNVSDQLKALFRTRETFEQLMDGCDRAKAAVMSDPPEFFSDYYDGELFRRLHSSTMSNWNPDEELVVFLSMSTDGFEVFKERNISKEAWPLAFRILNIETQYRFRGTNTLQCAFAPGKHDSNYFDTFLTPLVDDICVLQDGIEIFCADGKVRITKVFVLFITADWPGASKVLGYLGHRAKLFCRFCLKKADYISAVRSLCVISDTDSVLQQSVIRCDPTSALTWLERECPFRRTNHETGQIWANLKAAQEAGHTSEIERIIQSRGIKRSPSIARLTLDRVHSFPYDPMHQALLGWVKHLIALLTGSFKHAARLRSPFILPADVLQRINSVLVRSKAHSPSSWGRHPLDLTKLSKFKAEDFKLFGLYYGAVLFQGQGVHEDITRIWKVTAAVLSIAFDPTPARSDIQSLQQNVAILHAQFGSIFL